MIHAIRFIKFSGDEDSWLGRVFAARKTELDWLLKTRMNNLGINALWNFSPDLVRQGFSSLLTTRSCRSSGPIVARRTSLMLGSHSLPQVMIVSIACFTLVAHQQLTVPVAFTALALFGMVRAPMTMLPTSITQLLQTWVSIQRIEQFFEDDEVEPWVSSLRDDSAALPADAEGSKDEVSISSGTFVYHEKDSGPKAAASTEPAPAPAPALGADGVEPERKFELADIDVRFPEGKLSLVCGPTGSGKTSLFLALLGGTPPFPSPRSRAANSLCGRSRRDDVSLGHCPPSQGVGRLGPRRLDGAVQRRRIRGAAPLAAARLDSQRACPVFPLSPAAVLTVAVPRAEHPLWLTIREGALRAGHRGMCTAGRPRHV